MLNQINKIVQADTGVLQNLANSESKLNDLNYQMADLILEYDKSIEGLSSTSFFNFDNLSFMALLIGLLLLAFGLWFLQKELKYFSPKKSKIKHHKFEVQTKLSSEQIKSNIKKKDFTIILEQGKQKQIKRKPIKVKVIKVK